MLLNCGTGEDSCKSLGLQGDPTSPFYRRPVLGVRWKDWWWAWNFNTLATSCEELTHWKRPWCWEGLKSGGEGDDRASVWHHRLNAHEFGWTPGVGDGQGGLACCNSWSLKESDTTEQLNWTLLFLSYMSPDVSWMLGKPTRSPFKTEGSVFQAAGNAVNYQLELSTLSKNGPLMKSSLTQGNAPFPTLIQWLPGRWMIYLSF